MARLQKKSKDIEKYLTYDPRADKDVYGYVSAALIQHRFALTGWNELSKIVNPIRAGPRPLPKRLEFSADYTSVRAIRDHSYPDHLIPLCPGPQSRWIRMAIVRPTQKDVSRSILSRYCPLIDAVMTIINASDVPFCIYGTTEDAYRIIQSEGIPRKAEYVQFTDIPAAIPENSTVVIHLDAEKYLRAGMKLYRLSDGTLAAKGNNYGLVRPCFFKKIDLLSS